MFSLYDLFKKLAFAMDAENAHTKALHFLHHYPEIAKFVFHSNEDFSDARMALTVGKVNWKFPVGLAAGLDKNGEAFDFFSSLPFGALEVGTVTPRPQPGNERPRLFRYPEEESLRNCMGFNNHGSDELYRALENFSRRQTPIGVNLGKNKDTPAHRAPEDYRILFEKFKDIADYLVVNVSSPNTPGLRDLQKASELKEIFSEIQRVRTNVKTPLYLKISPDMSPADLPAVIDVAKEYSLDALIATNTTIMPERGAGGVSGRALYEKAKSMRTHCLEALSETPEIDFIGVGGFSSFEQLWDYWKEGGRGIQLYTSFIFQGPEVLYSIYRNIDAKMKKYKVHSINELMAIAREDK